MTRVLIVEDSPTQAEHLRYILLSEGFEVDAARDAETAMALLRTQSFELVVSDVVMPGRSGYDLCRDIKTSERSHLTPVILLTSLSDPMDIIRGLECGADNFITKPYEPEQLVARLRTVIDNKRLRAAGKLQFGVEVVFLGKTFTVTSDKEQILDLLISTFEDIVRTNSGLQESRAQLAAAKAEIERYAQQLEQRVIERTTTLMERQKQLAQAQAIAHLGSWRLTLADDLYDWSDEMYRIYGVDPASFRPTRQAAEDRILAEDRAKVNERQAQAVASKLPCSYEFRVVRPGGELRHCWAEGQCQPNAAGDVVALFGVVQDVTDRKMLEQQLNRAQRIEAVGQLTGGIAHDFNNLLAIVIGNLDLLQEHIEGNPKAAPLAENALQASMRGADLTRQLLAFSRRQPLEPRPLDANDLVRSVAKLIGRTLSGNIEVRIATTGRPASVIADPSQVESAIVNLAVNAQHAMPGGGLLTIETALVHLDRDYAEANLEVAAGDYICIAVTDTGSGIAPDVIGRVFEPFFTTKEAGQGTGLGLSQVYGFVKQSGGHVKIYSEVGKGTTVRLYLPHHAAGEASPVATLREEGCPLGRGELILVVDDNATLRKALLSQLAQLAYRTLEADDTAHALGMIEEEPGIDLLLADVIMPDMGGEDLARAVRARRPGIKVLLCSGFPGRAMSARNHAALEYSFLSKPFRRVELARKLREVLGGS